MLNYVEIVNDKWAFCPEKKCFKCKKDLSDVKYKEEVVTSCFYCSHSFLE